MEIYLTNLYVLNNVEVHAISRSANMHIDDRGLSETDCKHRLYLHMHGHNDRLKPTGHRVFTLFYKSGSLFPQSINAIARNVYGK